jgi:hypothetical protein
MPHVDQGTKSACDGILWSECTKMPRIPGILSYDVPLYDLSGVTASYRGDNDARLRLPSPDEKIGCQMFTVCLLLLLFLFSATSFLMTGTLLHVRSCGTHNVVCTTGRPCLRCFRQ